MEHTISRGERETQNRPGSGGTIGRGTGKKGKSGKKVFKRKMTGSRGIVSRLIMIHEKSRPRKGRKRGIEDLGKGPWIRRNRSFRVFAGWAIEGVNSREKGEA